MLALLILPVLISGFFVCNHNPFYYYRIHRFEGQYLYLKSAQAGALCFAIALFGCLFLAKYAPATLCGYDIDLVAWLVDLLSDSMFVQKKDVSVWAWTLIASLATFAVGMVWVALAKLYLRIARDGVENAKILLMHSILADSPLDRVLMKSFIHLTPVMLSLSDRKVYVGIVSSMGEPNESEGFDQEIAIIPIMSGYRDKDDLSVSFTTDYQTIDKDVFLTIRQEMITAATEFDFQIYEDFSAEPSASE